jgi:hypothetical protein
MLINEITYSSGKTIQEESYQPRSFHFSAKAELLETDNVQECYDKLKEEVQKALDREVMKWANPQKFVRQALKDKLNDKPF